ncbi:MAG: hotdog domain-containing protein [Bacteroidota bacterium]
MNIDHPKSHTSLRWVKPEDLNANNTLFGGKLLQWIDEEAALYAILVLENRYLVTKFISEIDFIKAPNQGDLIELVFKACHYGRTSFCVSCEVRDRISREMILTIDKIVFVNLDPEGNPVPHGKTAI